MKPENRLRNDVHKLFPGSFHHEKMNNPFRSGTADDWYSGKHDLWVEWKWEPKFPRIVKPNLSPQQERWCDGRFAEGRNIKVVVGSPTGCILFATPTEWNEGRARDEAQVLSKLETANWILEQCGLEGCAKPRSARRKSTPSSSTPS